MSEWNGNTYRILVEAIVEANTADEAQATVGLLLAGRDPETGADGYIALNGPGSWAPTHKSIKLQDDVDELEPAGCIHGCLGECEDPGAGFIYEVAWS